MRIHAHPRPESCAQTDLEEAKAQEIAKLQNSLQAMQAKVDETNALLVKEKEAARKAIEEAPPVIKETPVIVEDTKKVESLTEEVESLKVIWFDPVITTYSLLRLDIYTFTKLSEFYCTQNNQYDQKSQGIRIFKE